MYISYICSCCIIIIIFIITRYYYNGIILLLLRLDTHLHFTYYEIIYHISITCNFYFLYFIVDVYLYI